MLVHSFSFLYPWQDHVLLRGHWLPMLSVIIQLVRQGSILFWGWALTLVHALRTVCLQLVITTPPRLASMRQLYVLPVLPPGILILIILCVFAPIATPAIGRRLRVWVSL